MTKEELIEKLKNIQKNDTKEVLSKRSLLKALNFGKLTKRTNDEIKSLLIQYDVETNPSNLHGIQSGNKVTLQRKPYARCKSGTEPIKTINIITSAKKYPVCVNPKDQLSTAISKMEEGRYSQLPVVDEKKYLLGYISWQTISNALLRNETSKYVQDYMCTDCLSVLQTEYLIDVAEKVNKRDFAIVTTTDKQVIGIVTTADVLNQCLSWTRPYLMLSDIETQLRQILHERILEEKMQEVCKEPIIPQAVSKIEQLTIGQYLKIIEDDSNWNRLHFSNVDKGCFRNLVEKVRQLRNNVMHFRPGNIKDEDEQTLHNYVEYLQTIRQRQEANEKQLSRDSNK